MDKRTSLHSAARPMGKLLSLSAAARLASVAKRSGKKVVACTGSFDLLHAGHVYSLQKAKSYGDLLFVGLNSDKSYRAYKDRRGPICSQSGRAALLCALSCVDYVVLFDELHPVHFVSVLKPSIYANAASYGRDCVEAEAVKKVGGKLKLIPIQNGLSTSALITRILARYASITAMGPSGRPSTLQRRKAVFLDRDGVLIRDVGYARSPSQIKFMPKIIAKLKAYQQKKYALVVITNQSGVARGYFSEKAVQNFHRVLEGKLRSHGVRLSGIYYCPHHPQGVVKKYSIPCDCRKPGTALIQKAAKELYLDLAHSLFIGDKDSDIQAGRRAGMKTLRVRG